MKDSLSPKEDSNDIEIAFVLAPEKSQILKKEIKRQPLKLNMLQHISALAIGLGT